MSKHPKINSLDIAIQKMIEVYSGIDGFKNARTDPKLMAAMVFISAKIQGLNATRQLIIQSFVPAINKLASDTNGQVSTSIYKNVIKQSVEDNLQMMKDDTIRLGYVIFFHKYENFVKDYISYLEKRAVEYTEVTGQTVVSFCKSRFGFDPFAWYKYPVIHKINFISNCTKHHDGKCKLDNSKHTKPNMYANVPDAETLKPSLQQFKDDTSAVIQSIANHFLPILENANMIRSYEGIVRACDGLIDTCKKGLELSERDDAEKWSEEIKLYRQDAQMYREKVSLAEQAIALSINALEAAAI
jgi:hypothetical protein